MRRAGRTKSLAGLADAFYTSSVSYSLTVVLLFCQKLCVSVHACRSVWEVDTYVHENK